MPISPACVFAFNSCVDMVACPTLSDAEKFLGKRITSGGEIPVDAGTAERASAFFKWKEARIGGQAGNMANAAAALGVKCLAHAYNLSPRQRKLFASGVEVSGEETGEESVHYVLELKLRSGKRDRLILTHDPANSGLLISPSFASRSAEFIAAGCNRAVVSGFHLLKARDAEARLESASQLIRNWRKANPSLRIHFEAGDFADRKVMGLVAEYVLPFVDSVGMNEEEMHALAPFLAGSGVGEIVVHTADYASATSRLRERNALTRSISFGHALAAHRATTGKFATLADALALMADVPTPEFNRDSVLVPSIKITPKWTVGLGDSFAAGCFLME